MLRAIAAYLLALPVVALAFWCINAWLYPPAQPTSLLALVLSATYFAPLLLVLGLPGLAILVA